MTEKKHRDYPKSVSGHQDDGGEPKPDQRPVLTDDPDDQVGIDQATDENQPVQLDVK